MLAVFGENDVPGPVPSACELSIAGNIWDDSLRRCSGMQVTGVIGNALYSCGVANVDVLRIVSRIKCDTNGMVQADCAYKTPEV
jgi:hypothetical protein